MKTMASDNCELIYAFVKVSIIPKIKAPSTAPGIEPIPPSTAAIKAFIPGREPIYGDTTGYDAQ